jgi:chromosome segregation ATPase
MKNFQQNLLIVLALALCGLCVYQWYGQTLQRNQIQKLNQMAYEQGAAIQGYTNSIADMDRQIAQMDGRITVLKETVRTNEQVSTSQKREIQRLETVTEGYTNQISEYKKAVDSLEARLKEAYAGIEKQNDVMKELVAQRDELVKKFNDSVKDRNDVVNKYNDLVSQAQKAQAADAKK